MFLVLLDKTMSELAVELDSSKEFAAQRTCKYSQLGLKEA
jgi:hypothetical protein